MAIMGYPATFLVGGLSCMALALHPNSSNAVSAYFAWCGLASAGYAMKRSYELQVEGAIANTMREYQVSSTAAEAEIRINQIYEAAYPQQQPMIMPGVEFNSEEYFNWDNFIIDYDNYPHALIEGNTGCGKSVTATAMCLYFGGTNVVSNPHKKPGDYPGMVQHCSGGRYGNWKKAKIPEHYLTSNESMKELFESFLSGNLPFSCSCAHFLKIIYIEMKRRYRLRDKGHENYPYINVIVDELNSTIDNLKGSKIPEEKDNDDDDSDKLILNTSKQCLSALLREARKVKIRIIGLVQSAELDALDFKGMGSVRKSFVRIRLGEMARDYSKKTDPKTYSWCNTEKYPILVKDQPAKLPIPFISVQRETLQEIAAISDDKIEENHNNFDGNYDEKTHNNEETKNENNANNNSENNSSNNYDKESGNFSDSKIDLAKDNLPTLEQIEQEILAFCALQKSVTAREVQRAFKKYKLSAEAIKSILRDFERKGLGSVTEKKVGGAVSVTFTISDSSGDS